LNVIFILVTENMAVVCGLVKMELVGERGVIAMMRELLLGGARRVQVEERQSRLYSSAGGRLFGFVCLRR
jgi:hypothetical protein